MQCIDATHPVKNVHKLFRVKSSSAEFFQLFLVKANKVRARGDVTLRWKRKRKKFNHIMLRGVNCRHFPVVYTGESAHFVVCNKVIVLILLGYLGLANTHVSWSEIVVN